jgi:small-conductance mechanosensitive channel
MNLTDWLRAQGVPIPTDPNVTAIAGAIVLILLSFGVGWWVGQHAGPRLTAIAYRWAGRHGIVPRTGAVLVGMAMAAIMLWAGSPMFAASPLASVLVAVALGVAVARLAYAVARLAGLGGVTAGVLAVLALVATISGALGGLQPLIAALDRARLTVGTREISLLSTVNTVLVIAILYAVARLANRVLTHSIGRMSRLDVSQRTLVQKLAGIAVIVLAGLIGVDLLGIDLTALAVFSGALGLAVGFGLQKTVGNLLSGLILLMDRSVKPGDVIVVGDTFGAVSKIGVRAVSVITRDGKEHLIPNEQLMVEPVENWSYSSRDVRIHIPVGVAYSTDLPLAQKLMIEAATAADRVLKTPAPTVWLRGFGDSSVDHEILAWISDPEAGVGNVQSDILNRLWLLFQEHKIEIPYPQSDVHIRSLPGSEPDDLGPPSAD